jgi:RimJ/RimL family protein N-acetyltransferase
VDPEQGWETERLVLEPVRREHAEELFPLMNDPALYVYTGNGPFPLEEMTQRFERWETRVSRDGGERWCNWIIRDRSDLAGLGVLQATLPMDGPAAGPAMVAWLVGRHVQGRGYATEAATGLVGRLRAEGWTVIAWIHPEHRASQRVASKAGLKLTEEWADGEQQWSSAG